MVKRRFFDLKNVILSLKAFMTSIVTGLVLFIPIILARYFFNQLNMPFLGLGFSLITVALYLYAWGFFGNKLFNIRD